MLARYFAVLALVGAVGACGDAVFEPSTSTFVQVDYMGRPAVATVFLPSAKKDAYNLSVPTAQRAGYKGDVTGFLVNVAGYSAADADALADVLLPDILTVDLTQPSGYLNGRKPEDDVTTASLTLVFGPGTPLSDDHVDGNDAAYPSTFPYLAAPHVP